MVTGESGTCITVGCSNAGVYVLDYCGDHYDTITWGSLLLRDPGITSNGQGDVLSLSCDPFVRAAN